MSAAGTTAAGRAESVLRDVDHVELRHLCDLSVDLDTQAIPSPGANRINFVLARGICTGERLSGTFRPGGGDWLVLGSDRIGRIDVRATLETDDGELIYMTNTGRFVLSEDAIARLGAGERLGPEEIYARTCPLFETGSERYAWVNGLVTVAVNAIAIDHVDYRIFEVL